MRGLVLVPLPHDELAVRVVDEGPRELAALDEELELRQVRAGEMVRQISRRKPKRAVSRESHHQEVSAAIFFVLADIKVAVEAILSYIRTTTMNGKKRKTLTPEEREAREIRSEAMDRWIQDKLERWEAEMRAKDPNYRGLGYWIEPVKAEREAENAA
jgi:hypothetical protein